MIIAPKLAENETIKPKCALEVVEFQMLSSDLVASLKKCRSIATAGHVYYHLPFGMHELYRYTAVYNLVELERLLNNLHGNERLVMHCDMDPDTFADIGGFDTLQFIKEMYAPIILLENSINSPSSDVRRCFAWEIAEKAGFPIVCDSTHLHASEYLYGIDLTVPEGCEYVHFAACLNRDGVVDVKGTHGRKHLSYTDAKQDLEYLEKKGVNLDTVTLVTEISEDDYANRPDQRTEISYVQRFCQDTGRRYV